MKPLPTLRKEQIMPKVNAEARDMVATENRALAQKPFKCFECKQKMRKGYCSRCDEFYNVGHLSSCSRRNERGQEGDHGSC